MQMGMEMEMGMERDGDGLLPYYPPVNVPNECVHS